MTATAHTFSASACFAVLVGGATHILASLGRPRERGGKARGATAPRSHAAHHPSYDPCCVYANLSIGCKADSRFLQHKRSRIVAARDTLVYPRCHIGGLLVHHMEERP